MKCMFLKDTTGKCEKCGCEDDAPTEAGDLQARTVLANRYMVGKSYANNGETISYLGYDLEEECAVYIKEYAPAALCDRRQDGSIYIRPGSETNYKTLMDQYEDILKGLKKTDLKRGILPVLDIITQNNTVYGVFRYVHLISFAKFLTRCGGELTWSQCKRLFIPLLNTVAALHANNILHRGISPDTVYIDKNGLLWLSGFSTSAHRTDRSEVDSQLFPGYSAPEQYSLSSWQGTWTDVYALGALMYKTMTGTMPPESITRKINDNLCPCAQLNTSIPRQISQAITDAMAVPVEQRTQTVADFLGNLLETAESNTTVYSADLAKQEPHPPARTESRPARAQQAQSSRPKKKQPAGHAALYTVSAMLLTVVVLGSMAWWLIQNYFINPDGNQVLELPGLPVASSGSTDASSGGGGNQAAAGSSKLPKFIGMSEESVLDNPLYEGKYLFSIKREDNDDVMEGLIFNQSPDAGTDIQDKSTVVLYVSKGSPTVLMPDLAGQTVEFAKQTLSAAGVLNVEVMEAYEEGDPGKVLRTNIQPDTPIRKNKDKVILIVPKEQETEETTAEPEDGETEQAPDTQPGGTSSVVIEIVPPRRPDTED